MKKTLLTRIKAIAVALSMFLTAGFSLTACDLGVNDVADVMGLKSRDQDLISFIVESADELVNQYLPTLTESITAYFEAEMAKENHGVIGGFLDTLDLPGLVGGYVEDNQAELLDMFKDMLLTEGVDGSSLLDSDILDAIADSITNNQTMKDNIMQSILDMFDDEDSDLANQLVGKIIDHPDLVSEDFINKFVTSDAFLNALEDPNNGIVDSLMANPVFVDSLLENEAFIATFSDPNSAIVQALLKNNALETVIADAAADAAAAAIDAYAKQHGLPPYNPVVPGTEPRDSGSEQTTPDTDEQENDQTSAS